MGKVFRSFFLQPTMIMLYVFTIYVAATLCVILFSPDVKTEPEILFLVAACVLLFAVFYKLACIPYSRLKKYMASLPVAEREDMAEWGEFVRNRFMSL